MYISIYIYIYTKGVFVSLAHAGVGWPLRSGGARLGILYYNIMLLYCTVMLLHSIVIYILCLIILVLLYDYIYIYSIS